MRHPLSGAARTELRSLSMLGTRSAGDSYSKEQLLVTTMQQVSMHVLAVCLHSVEVLLFTHLIVFLLSCNQLSFQSKQTKYVQQAILKNNQHIHYNVSTYDCSQTELGGTIQTVSWPSTRHCASTLWPYRASKHSKPM